MSGIAGLLGLAACGSSLDCTGDYDCVTRPQVVIPAATPAPAAAPGWHGWTGAQAARSLAPAVRARLLPPAGTSYLALGVSADGTRLVAVDTGGGVTERPLAGGATTSLPSLPVAQELDETAWTAAATPDLQTLATAGGDDVTIQHTASGASSGEVRAAMPPLATPRELAFSQDGKWLAFVDKAGNTHLVDVATRSARLLPTPGVVRSLHAGTAESLAFTPDDATLAVGTNDGNIDLWAVTSGKMTATLTDPNERTGPFAPGLGALAFADSGALLAAADDAGNVYLWDTARRTVLGALRGTPATDPMSSLSAALSPDGRLLAVSFGDGTIGVWSVATGDRLADLRGGDVLIEDPVAFGLSGSLLVSLNNNGGITEWNL